MGELAIAVLDDYQDVARVYGDWDRVPRPAALTVFNDHVAEKDALALRLAPFDVVVAMRERTAFDAELLGRLPRLQLLVTTGMRNPAIDVAAASELGIAVAGTRGLETPTVELTWGLILALLRRIPEEDRRVRDGGWQRTVGADAAGRILGVVGLGTIGARVATIAHAFGMPVLAWSENLRPEAAERVGARLVTKDELLSTADVVTLHVRLSPRTRGLLGERELRRMKSSAFLVNTSRGPIVDEAALLMALREGRLAGAGLDVFDSEPLPADHPWRSAPRTVLTPHIGYVTERAYELYFGDVVADICAFAAGTVLRGLDAATGSSPGRRA